MPQSRRSLAITDAYRRRIFALRGQLQAQAPRIWDQADRLASVVETAQIAGCRFTAAYLTAFLASETGKRTRPITIDSAAYSGSTADGQPLAEGMRSPLIGFFAARKNGEPNPERVGIDRAVRQVGMNYDAAHRTALMDTITHSDHFDGWNRALRGTCGACAASATGLSHSPYFPVHPGCQCVAEPRVFGAIDHFTRPTGIEVFHDKSKAEQDEMVGPEAAQKLRSGEITLADLIGHSHLDSDAPDILTQAPTG